MMKPFIVITAMMMMMSSSSNASSNCSSAYINCMCHSIETLIYPVECVQMLTPFAKFLHNNLNSTTRIALSISSSQSRKLAISVTDLYKSGGSAYNKTLESCKGYVTDARDNVHDSFVQIKNLTREKDPLFLLSNVQTWMSSAITNLGNCQEDATDYVKDDANDDASQLFRKVVLNGTQRVTKVISTSLSLVNVLAGQTPYPTQCR